MERLLYSVADLLERGAMEQPRELGHLFHQLNNQLGIILANAELLEAKSADEMARARAALERALGQIADDAEHIHHGRERHRPRSADLEPRR